MASPSWLVSVPTSARSSQSVGSKLTFVPGEVRAALEAATRLPDEMRAQIRQYKRDMSNCSSSYNGHSVPSAGTSDSEEVQNGLGFQLGYPDQNAGTYPSQFQGLSLY